MEEDEISKIAQAVSGAVAKLNADTRSKEPERVGKDFEKETFNCPTCGSPVNARTAFCPNCGESLEWAD